MSLSASDSSSLNENDDSILTYDSEFDSSLHSSYMPERPLECSFLLNTLIESLSCSSDYGYGSNLTSCLMMQPGDSNYGVRSSLSVV